MTQVAFAHPFRALSLSFKRAPLAVREQLALDETACHQLLRTLRHELGLTDLLVLSTCQRTEVYYAARADRSTEIMQALGQLKNCLIDPGWQPYFEVMSDAAAAARHLFAVALGLEARVLGDWQIIGQVKQAYRWAVQAEAAGPFLHRLLHAVFAAHKRVQQETSFRSGTASASGAAVELVAELTAQLASPRVLVVGVGSIGADVCRHLAARNAFDRVALCNRTRSKAVVLAAECRLDLVEFDELPTALREADVVISAITCPQAFFTPRLVAETMQCNRKLFVDLSMPRSVAPAVAQVPGVTLYNIDAIKSKTSAALELRWAAVPQVHAIIANHLAELHTWSQTLRVSPLIHQLKNHLEALRRQEVSRYSRRLSPTETTLIEAATRSLMQKVLKQQVLHLKRVSLCDGAEPLLAQFSKLFAFENERAS
ncbi:glutamyl-tRNA reductase [Hymenobacter sp. H14-R3]|uniref:glutamyl-tRNA reductase n=1 Tax=Hymenobacter sp. H14-R3 TaxID=3046308 RepID=UPI0024B92D78|nr:glutamyl-tRNA reductase [Hymenobacter sp. H14-R3]MDJ0367706.1 glutamyl-tRNA reductase [Hymenobacter sp. H14-R3]